MQRGDTTARHLLVRGDFRRLLATRLLAQFGDGVFQAALAGTVLFNPQRAADPVDVAAGFAILLLPYSFVGPFAGVWLDRWSRRQVLLRANLVRAGLVAVVAALVLGGIEGTAFYAAGLAVFSVNRFVLAALSAALPHTTDAPSLVPANALSTTSGAIATVVGGVGALAALEAVAADNSGYATVALCAAVPYLAAAAVVAGFGRAYLGPDSMARTPRLSAREVAAGMVAGARHAWTRAPAAAALTAISLHRFHYGVLTLVTLLLYRNSFTASEWRWFPGGLVGLGEVVAAGAAGTLLAAVVTPPAVRRIGKRRWVILLLLTCGAAQLVLGLTFAPPGVVGAALVLGVVGQGVKICVDSTLQKTIDDGHRGRVFSVYDTLFNVSFVVALLGGAALLPPSGLAPGALVAVAVGYVLAAVTFATMTRRH